MITTIIACIIANILTAAIVVGVAYYKIWVRKIRSL